MYDYRKPKNNVYYTKRIQKMSGQYKECKCCQYEWRSRDDFLSDPNIKLIGYQPNFFQLKLGWLLFNHYPCRTTLAVSVADMQDMYAGELFGEIMMDTEDCPGYCKNKYELEQCGNKKCECNYVREVILKIKNKEEERQTVEKPG
jgi:hypothetical protein